MQKSFHLSVLFCLLLVFQGSPQTSTLQVKPEYVYQHPSKDKLSWQRLNLSLATTYISSILTVGNPDSSLIIASQSLGMSRLPVAAAGIDDPELFAQSQWFDEKDPGKGIRLLSQATGKRQLELLILLGAYYNFQPRSFQLHKDSIEYFLKQAVDKSKAINEKKLGRVALSQLIKLYSMSADTTNRDATLNKLINECRSTGDKQTEARALSYRGLYSFFPKNVAPTRALISSLMNEKISYFYKAQKVYHEMNDAEGEINTLINVFIYHAALSHFDTAYTILQEALELQYSINYPYTHYTTDMLALVTSGQSKFGEPLKYCLETVRTAEATRDSIGWSTFYARLGLLYLTDGQHLDESLKWMHKALDRYVMIKNPNIYQTLYNILDVKIQQGKMGKDEFDLTTSITKKVPPGNSSDSIFHHITFAICYMGMKQYQTAEQYALSADSIVNHAKIRGNNTAYERSMIYATLGSVYFRTGQYAKAKKYIELELSDPARHATLVNEIESYKQLIFIDSIFNDAPSALKHYRKYVALTDSNFRASRMRQAEELQVMYQTKEKEDQIALLNEQAKLEQANLKQATVMKNVTIGGIVVALIIAGLLYRQSRLRKKTNKVIMHKNGQLQHLLTEKEWLLKEIHHRVKNNLQIVMSLLNSQSAFIDNEPALTAIHDSQHRVHAMSLIHQKLYNAENLSSIDMSLYIRELVAYLADSFTIGQRIRFELNVERIELDVSQAVPLGLILNEAITNSIKYAFPDGRNGLISVSLSKTASNYLLLSISDNGVGMPQLLSNKKPGSLGMSLMAGLSEDLEGKFSIESNNGTTIKISFAHEPVVRRGDELATSLN